MQGCAGGVTTRYSSDHGGAGRSGVTGGGLLDVACCENVQGRRIWSALLPAVPPLDSETPRCSVTAALALEATVIAWHRRAARTS